MKILIISDAWYPQVNGVVRTYEHIQRVLNGQGHDIKVIGPDDFDYKIPMPGYSEIQLVLFPNKKLNQTIEEFQPDALHVATEGPLGRAARRYCLKKNIPFTTSYHTQFPTYFAMRMSKHFSKSFNFFHTVGVRYIRKFHNAASGVFVTTKSMSKELQSWGMTTNIYPLTRGVNKDIFHLGEATLFNDLKKPVALYVGRLAIEKNLEEFLGMPWQGTKLIVGHGPSEESFRKKYKDVVFLGKKTGKELGHCYRSSDLFVFPSYTDTFGIVLIEALSCGIPIAAHPVTGPIDIVTKDSLGALNDNLATACEKALQGGTKEERSEHVATHYSWEKAAQQFLETSQKIARQAANS
ncbi:MAG: glycosyltransferase family 1 protein [Pseudomonadota bacterium]